VGRCLRTRTGIRPVYVSPGSGYDVAGAADLVLSLADRYRLPEPTRRAHAGVSEWKRELTGVLTPGAEGDSDDT
jgi:deoxyribonuclease V